MVVCRRKKSWVVDDEGEALTEGSGGVQNRGKFEDDGGFVRGGGIAIHSGGEVVICRLNGGEDLTVEVSEKWDAADEDEEGFGL